MEMRFTYDAQHRLINVEEYEAGAPSGSIAYAYTSGKITEVWKEGADSETTVYTLDASGKVISWESQGNDAGRVLTSEGRLEYDGDRLIAAFATCNGVESTDKIYWDADNMIKVAHYENEETGTGFTFGKELNNPQVNLDLNYIVTDSEWLDCLAFDSFMVKAMGYVGARSARMIADENDFGPDIPAETHTYRYTTDSRGLITRVEIKDIDAVSPNVYIITYKEVK